MAAPRDPIHQRLAAEVIKRGQNLPVAGINHDDVGRVIPVPTTRHHATTLDIDPGRHDLFTRTTVGGRAAAFEPRQSNDGVQPLRPPQA